MSAWHRIGTITAAGVAALWFALIWFMGNFLYELIWAFLEDHRVNHADALAYALTGIIPLIFCIIIVVAIYYALRRELLGIGHRDTAKTETVPSEASVLEQQTGRISGNAQTLPSQTSPSAARHHYIRVAEAVCYIADESEWGWAVRIAPPDSRGLRQQPRYAAIDEFVRAARGGNIIVWGRFNRAGEHQLISQQYWHYATLDIRTIFGEGQPAATCPISADLLERERFNSYDGLLVDEEEVRRTWPEAKRKPR